MTIKRLKEIIADLPDEMKVIIPGEPKEGFTGEWLSPCGADTEAIEMPAEDLDDEEIQEREKLNQPVEMEKYFAIVPCGFYEDHDNSHQLN